MTGATSEPPGSNEPLRRLRVAVPDLAPVGSAPEREEVSAATAKVEAPSKDLSGVVHFDVTRSLTDPHAFLAIEVFRDRDTLDRQNAQAEIAALLRVIDTGALGGDCEWTTWETSTGQ